MKTSQVVTLSGTPHLDVVDIACVVVITVGAAAASGPINVALPAMSPRLLIVSPYDRWLEDFSVQFSIIEPHPCVVPAKVPP